MNIMNCTLVFAALLSVTGQASAQVDQVFAVRGLPVGVSMEEFRKFPIVNDDGNTDLQTWCSNDTDPKAKKFLLSEDDQQLGVVECKWYSKRPGAAWMSVDDHWIDLGKGKGTPVFRFIDDGTGLKLFEIKFYANTQYYSDVYAALSANYGKPKETSVPFKTRAGADFTSTTSNWSNSTSFITMIYRCRHLERFCLNYNHTKLTKIYMDKKRILDAEAAGKI